MNRLQPNLRNLLSKKRKKRTRKENGTGTVQAPGKLVVPGDETALEAKARRQRIRHLQSEIARAEDFIRVARKEISRLQNSLKGTDNDKATT